MRRLCGQVRGLRVKSLLFITPQVLPRSHTNSHLGTHIYTYVRGTFPAFVAEADLGEFNLGCTNFSLGGQGWKWCLCAGRCVNRGQTEGKTERGEGEGEK